MTDETPLTDSQLIEALQRSLIDCYRASALLALAAFGDDSVPARAMQDYIQSTQQRLKALGVMFQDQRH